MKIVKLTVENIMRVSAVEIEPTGNVVVIGGNNGAGKSSVLSAIVMALGGKDHAVEQPVRAGEERGRIVVDLGDIAVERVFLAGGSTRLVVRATNGAVFPSPQGMLDALVGKLAFDPLAFARAKEKEQAETLRRIVGLDTSKVDQERAATFAKRTETNRELERQRGLLAMMKEPPPDTPDNEPDPAELVRQRDALQRRNAARQEVIVAPSRASAARVQAEQRRDAAREDIDRLANALELAKNELGRRETDLQRAQAAYDDAVVASQKAVAELEDSGDLDTRIASCQATSAAVRLKQARAQAMAVIDVVKASADALTATIESCDETRRKMIAELQFPVPGLAFADDGGGVKLNGLPFSQASSAEQLRASVAIGMALNPKLRVMIVRDGSLLDDNGLKLLGELAAAADAQVWVERVGRGQEVAFLIEDGHIAERGDHLEV